LNNYLTTIFDKYFQLRKVISLRKYNTGTVMETKIAVRESAASAKHFTDIKKYNSGTGV